VVDAHQIDLERLVASARDAARSHWRNSHLYGIGEVRGISSDEVFTGSFWEQDIGKELQQESDRVRPLVWRQALADQNVSDEALLNVLCEASAKEGTGPHTPYPGTLELLADIKERVPLGIVTNGDKRVQRLKVKKSGLENFFQSVVVSGDFGLTVAKPDPEPFLQALRSLNVPPSATVMVGNDQVNDVHGAAMLGMRTVWVNRTGSPFDGPTEPDHEISDLRELPGILGLQS